MLQQQTQLYWIQNRDAGSNQIISVLFALSHYAEHWWLMSKNS